MGPLLRRYGLTSLVCVVLVILIGTARSMDIEFDERTAPITTSGDVGETVDTGTFTLTVEDVRLASTVVEEGGGDILGDDLPDDAAAPAAPEGTAAPEDTADTETPGDAPDDTADPETPPGDDTDDEDADDEPAADPTQAPAEGTGLAAEGVWVVVQATATATDRGLRLHTPARLDVADDLSFGSVSLPSTLDSVHIEPGIPMSGAFLFEIPEDKLVDPELRVVAAGVDSRLGGEAAVDLQLDEAEIETMVNEMSEPVTIPAATA